MSLGRTEKPTGDVRDIAGDYLAAYQAEYKLYRDVGLDDKADEVAKVLEDLGHPVKEKAVKKAPAKQRAVAHDATEKAVEGDVNPKA